jgi:hypothetical protein
LYIEKEREEEKREPVWTAGIHGSPGLDGIHGTLALL